MTQGNVTYLIVFISEYKRLKINEAINSALRGKEQMLFS
jgi:hypothetical protein